MTKVTLIGDIHIGNRNADIDAFKRALKAAQKVILMGDIIEGITKKDLRHSRYDTILTYDEQITTTIDILKPYKSKILRYVIGNHEDTLLSISDIDSVNLICSTLKIKSIYTETIRIDDIDLFITHGTGAAATYQGAVTKLINYSKDHQADIYFMGHTHKLFDIMIGHNPEPYRIVNTGTLMVNAEYGTKKAFPDSIKGYYVLNTVNNKLTKVLV